MVSTTPATEALQPGQLLRSFEPFNQLDAAVAAELEALLEPRRYRLGQTVLRPEVMPDGLLLLRSGVLRSLALDPISGELRTLELLEAGALAGWCSLLRADPCENLRASAEADLLLLPAEAFRQLLAQHDELRLWFATTLPGSELHGLLRALAAGDPRWLAPLQSWPAIQGQARVRSLPPGPQQPLGLTETSLWFISSGGAHAAPWEPGQSPAPPPPGEPWLRLIGLPPQLPVQPAEEVLPEAEQLVQTPPPGLAVGEALSPPVQAGAPGTERGELDSAGSYALSPEAPAGRQEGPGLLRLRRASGPRDIPIAITLALSRYFGIPVNRDYLFDLVDAVLKRQPEVDLQHLGQILDALGLRVVLSELPVDRLNRAQCPAVLYKQGHFAILDGVDGDGQLRLLEPELGPIHMAPQQLMADGEASLQLLLLERKPGAKQENFSWAWFRPYLREHRRSLVEVGILSVIINVLGLALPLGLLLIIDTVRSTADLGALATVATIILLAAVLKAIFTSLREYIFLDVANRIDQDTKSRILDHLVRLPQGFFDSRPVGRVLFYFNQMDKLREFLLGSSLTLAVDLLFSVIYLGVMLSLNVTLTFIAVATLPLILILTLVSDPLVRGQIKATNGEQIRTFSYLSEAITGIQTIKAQNAETSTRWEFQERYARYLGENFKLRITKKTISSIAKLIGELNRVILIVVAMYLVISAGLTIGGLFAFRILSGYVTRPIVELTSTWQQFKEVSAAIGLIGDVVDRPTEQSDAEALNVPMPPVRGDVRFEDVQFRYEPNQPLILEGVSLEVPAGSFVGLVGGSGSGKSTLLKLLPRFYEPSQGRISVDGFDINKTELYSLRRQIGVVPQDTVLFDGTIRDNLLLVKPDATSQELIRAARIACAHDFIMEQPRGYNSSVGERGAGLSGGQKQRLALARAVLQNPRMLILDEATSALDARTERQVCLNLLEAFRGRTVFFITHRLASVQPADCIVLMDKGAVMETGTHEELMRQQGWYYALYQSQHQEGAI
jgi:ATP-binding cassette subfamily B protein